MSPPALVFVKDRVVASENGFKVAQQIAKGRLQGEKPSRKAPTSCWKPMPKHTKAESLQTYLTEIGSGVAFAAVDAQSQGQEPIPV